MYVYARCVGCTRRLELSADPENPTPRTCGRVACRRVAEDRHAELEALEERLAPDPPEAGGRHRLREDRSQR